MKTEFIYFLICLLIPRLFTQWKDDTVLTLKSVSFTIIIELVLLIPLFYSLHSFIILLFFLITYHGLQFFLNWIFGKNKKKDDNIKTIYLVRIIEFGFIIFVGSFVFGIFLKDTDLNSYISKTISFITENNVLFINYDPLFSKRMIIYIFGLLLVTNEVNNLIRWILNFLKTDTNKATISEEQFNRGRIIGAIERILFYFFVITENFASIAFILAAKGFTRFKELDDKNFAEYVLIGTLLSCTAAIFCSFFIKEIIASCF